MQRLSDKAISTMTSFGKVNARFGLVWFGLPYTILDHSHVTFGFD